jgi:DNA adenine methylase
MAAAITRPILRYHGGKFRLAPWIIEHFPPHRVYVEPFGGAASVLLRKPRSFAEIYNDRWGVVVNVFRVMRDPNLAKQLERALRLTPFARDEFEADWPDDGAGAVEIARRAILRSYAGFGSASTNGAHSTGFRANSNRSHTTPAHDWASYPDHIARFTERLARVVIENRPAEQVMQQHDSADTLHYVDPPYPHETRNLRRGNAVYAFEMTTADHEQLAATLHALHGMVVLSSYRSDLYDRLYGDWHAEQTTALSDGAHERTEVLYLNPACVAQQRQHPLFASREQHP